MMNKEKSKTSESILESDKVFVNIQEPLIRYRVNKTGNTVTNKSTMIRQHVRVRNEFIDLSQKTPPLVGGDE